MEWRVPGVGGGGNGELLFNGGGVSTLQDAKCSGDGWIPAQSATERRT